MTESLALVAAIFSAIATGLAAWATWRAPLAAARLAEELRTASDLQNERKQRKLLVFANLMQERAFIGSDLAVRGLNLIDIVFNDSAEVRDAWANLYNGLQPPCVPPHVTTERLTELLEAMSRDVGLADRFRPDDFKRTYYPDAIAKEHAIQMDRRERTYADIQRQAAAANGPWPPAPQ